MDGHLFIFVFSLIFFIILVVYVFTSEHKDPPTQKHKKILKRLGLDESDISKLEKDDVSWYFKNKNTCVSSLYNKDNCNSYDNVCVKNIDDECTKLYEAVLGGGLHPECPLLY